MGKLTGKVARGQRRVKGNRRRHCGGAGARWRVGSRQLCIERRAGAEAVVAKIKAAGGAAKAVRADVSKPAEAKALVNAAVAEFGKVDILVNNAGVYEFLPLESITEKHFDRLFDLNVRGLVFTTQAAAGAFGDGGGAVINIGSVASQTAPAGGSVYSATKGAVDVLTKSLAAELGPKNIRVNAVLPGPVETDGTKNMPGFESFVTQILPQIPLGRVGQPRDIATVVSFLSSGDAGWITGQIIQAAGGLH